MYLGGGALDPAVSNHLSGIVIVCQNWKWAAYAHAAARVAGHACDNDLGAFSESLVISGENAEVGPASAMGSATTSFIRHCEEIWEKVTSTIGECVPDELQEKPGLWPYPHDKALHAKSKLRALRDRYDAKVQAFLEQEQSRHC